MPSGPPVFLTLIDFRGLRTRSNVITGKDIGHLRGEGGGGEMPESSRVELEENRRPKRLAFSVGELATERSDRISRSVIRVKAVIPIIVSVEATQGISRFTPIKKKKKTRI